MKKSKKTKGYTATPASMCITMMPEPILTPQSKQNLKEIKFQTAHSFPTSIQKSEEFTQEKLKECRKAISQNNFDRFCRIIYGTPTLQMSPDVQSNMYRYKNRLHGSRGRPAGGYSYNPTLIAGFVNGAVTTGQAHNRDQAFHLATELFNLDYDAIKRYFYQAMSADQFKTTFIETGESRDVTTEEMQKLASARSIFSK